MGDDRNQWWWKQQGLEAVLLLRTTGCSVFGYFFKILESVTRIQSREVQALCSACVSLGGILCRLYGGLGSRHVVI